MMANESLSKRDSEHDRDRSLIYQIRIRGHLGQPWQKWFEGLTLTLETDGNTLLTGPVVDQAALYGILKKVSDLGMPLLSVSSTGSGSQDK
jgi:hypothetical protein